MTQEFRALNRRRIVSGWPYSATLELWRWRRDPGSKDPADVELAIAIRERDAGLTRSTLSIAIALAALAMAFAAVIVQRPEMSEITAILFLLTAWAMLAATLALVLSVLDSRALTELYMLRHPPTPTAASGTMKKRRFEWLRRP